MLAIKHKHYVEVRKNGEKDEHIVKSTIILNHIN